MTRGNNTKKYVFNSKKYSFSLKVSSFVLFSYLIPSQKHDKLQIPDCDLHHLPGKVQGGIHAQKNKISSTGETYIPGCPEIKTHSGGTATIRPRPDEAICADKANGLQRPEISCI